jgi:hypothetical protein
MERNSNVAVLGTSIILFNEERIIRKHIVNKGHNKIRTQLLFNCALMHPTVIIRKSILHENNFAYDEKHEAAEDFGLWQRISFNYELANLNEILLKYRINENGITISAEKNIEKRDLIHQMIYRQGFEYLGVYPSENELKLFRLFSTGRRFIDFKEFEDLSRLLSEIRINAEKKNYDLNYVKKIFSSYLRLYGIKNNMKLKSLVHIHKKYFNSIFRFNFIEKIKYLIKRYLMR